MTVEAAPRAPESLEQARSAESLAHLHAKAKEAAEAYLRQADGERPDLIEHNQAVESVLRAFAGDKVHPAVFAAVWYHDIIDRFDERSAKYTSAKAEAAYWQLLDLLTDPALDSEVVKFSAHILADMVKTEQYSGKHRKDMAKESVQNGHGKVSDEVIKMIADHYEGDIPPEVWKTVSPLLDFAQMGEFAKDTNLEAMLVKAAELLVNMQHPSSERQSAWLQDVLEAESFYAPLCEVIGFDGLAMALRSQAHTIRLTQQGKGRQVREAQEKLRRITSVGLEAVLEKAVGGVGGPCISRVVEKDDSTGEYPVHIGEFALIKDDGMTVAGNWRLKTEGSLAAKLDSRQGESMDVLGLTIISEDTAQSAQDFADYLTSHLGVGSDTPFDAGDYQLCPAPSKRCAIYIQGSPEYKAAMRRALEERGMSGELIEEDSDEGRTDDDRSGEYRQYEVAKVTFKMKIEDEAGNIVEVPVEAQFVTRAERERSRTGAVAHIIYKFIRQQERILERKLTREERRTIIDSAKNVLKNVHRRRMMMSTGSLGVNERSEATCRDFLERLVKYQPNDEALAA
ncbi:MAG: hypothetical protein Q4B05_02515 [Candidatus Saccharibacteria bacterium]|nr:hypothetical protein [Candidatus Saccharibacteria bacterium]